MTAARHPAGFLERDMSLDLDQIFSHGLIEKLISQSGRYHDRDASEAWMKYDNFGEFYKARKHLFIVRYSRAELLIARVLQMYIVEQVNAVFRRDDSQLPPDGWDRINDAVQSAIESDSERLLGLLKEKWSKEYADLEVLNGNPAAVR